MACHIHQHHSRTEAQQRLPKKQLPTLRTHENLCQSLRNRYRKARPSGIVTGTQKLRNTFLESKKSSS